MLIANFVDSSRHFWPRDIWAIPSYQILSTVGSNHSNIDSCFLRTPRRKISKFETSNCSQNDKNWKILSLGEFSQNSKYWILWARIFHFLSSFKLRNYYSRGWVRRKQDSTLLTISIIISYLLIPLYMWLKTNDIGINRENRLRGFNYLKALRCDKLMS